MCAEQADFEFGGAASRMKPEREVAKREKRWVDQQASKEASKQAINTFRLDGKRQSLDTGWSLQQRAGSSNN